MSELSLNSPIDLRPLILYHIHQRKTVKISYENYKKLCEALKKPAISDDIYKYWFNKYVEENHNLKKNERALRITDIYACIYSDVIDNKPVENSFTKLREVFGNNKVEKSDHNDYYDLYRIERISSSVSNFLNPPRVDESDQHLAFSDFPEDVVTEIVNICDLQSYLNLRNVSHSLQIIVDHRARPLTDMSVLSKSAHMEIKSNNSVFVDTGFSELKYSPQCSLDIIEKRVFRELEFVLKNPKLRFKSVQFDTFFDFLEINELPEMLQSSVERNYKKNFLNLLKSLDHKIHTYHVDILAKNAEESVKILKCFEPGTLKKLKINNCIFKDDINEIAKTDQWKQAKHAEFLGRGAPSFEHFLHFNTFEVTIDTIPIDDLVWLCDNLSKSINFKSCILRTYETLDEKAMKSVLNLNETDSPHKYNILNSNLSIEFLSRFILNTISIQKI